MSRHVMSCQVIVVSCQMEPLSCLEFFEKPYVVEILKPSTVFVSDVTSIVLVPPCKETWLTSIFFLKLRLGV